MNWLNCLIQDDSEKVLSVAEQVEEAALGFYSAGGLFFVVGVVGGVLLLAAAVLGILYMLTVIAPGVTERCSGTLRERNMASFLAGLPILAAMIVVLTALKANPGLAFISVTLFVTLLLVGWAGASEDLGRRLFWVSGREGTRATHLASGWLVFVFAASFPVIGWFLILPYVSASGLGSMVMSFFRRPAPPATTTRGVEILD